MALTVIERPLGHKIIDDGTAFTIFNSGGDAAFTDSLSLTTGDYIYISGYVENYNGFWYVDKSGGIAYLKTNSDSDRVEFIVEANVTVFETVDHGWSCAHLPIVYKLESDLFPVNTIDPIATIIVVTDNNGLQSVGHTALTGSDSLFELDYVLLTNATESRVVQVLSVLLTTNTIINLSISDPVIYTGIQKYRNNYHALVKVYAGLEPGHTWASQKPYELAVTLKLIPDSNNEIAFSVNEILKSYLNIRNNDLLGTLPNNIDFFTMFYITTQEGFDVSDGTNITIDYGPEVNDSENYNGYAANAKLDFKNEYSGYLSDYIVDSALTGAKFLTLFETPTIFQDKYFDISFINNHVGPLFLAKLWVDINENVIYTSDDEPIKNYGQGVYRIPIPVTLEHGCTFENVHPAVYAPSTIYLSTTTFTPDLGGFTQFGSPANLWTYEGGPNDVLWYDYAHVVHDNVSVPVMDHVVSIPQGTTVRIQFALYQAFIAGTVTIQLQFTGVAACIAHQIDIIQGPLDTFYYDFNVALPSGACDYEKFSYFVFGDEQVGKALDVDYFIISGISSELITPSYTTTDPLYLRITIKNETDDQLSEAKTFKTNCNCENHSLCLTWLNNLGGLEYWNFTDGSDYVRNIGETGQTKKNIFPNWPKSYGKTADTIKKQTFRETSKGILVRSQALTLEDLEAIEYIKSSILVEIVYARGDKRRVLVDTDSWVSYKAIDKLYTLSFTINYTDDIPVQEL